MNNQEIKADAGKPRVSLVPTEIIRNIAVIRGYGVKKYGEKESWKSVEPERYRDAMFRHMLLYIEDPYGVDEESGLPHLWHLACNVAFLCELQKDGFKSGSTGVNLKDIKCLDLSGATETQKSKLKDMLVASAQAELKEYGTVVTPNNVPNSTVDADGFDWKEGNYITADKDYETNKCAGSDVDDEE